MKLSSDRLCRALLRLCAVALLALPFASCGNTSHANEEQTNGTLDARSPNALFWERGRWNFDKWQ